MDVIPDIQSSGFEGQYNYFINNNSFVENWISVSPLKQHWIYCQKIHNTTSQKKKKIMSNPSLFNVPTKHYMRELPSLYIYIYIYIYIN